MQSSADFAAWFMQSSPRVIKTIFPMRSLWFRIIFYILFILGLIWLLIMIFV